MTSKQKQRKAVARAKYESYLERKADKARRRRRNQIIIGSVVVVAIVGGLALWSGGAFTSNSPATAAPTPSTSGSPTPTPSTSQPPQFSSAKQVLTPGKAATATLVTNQGDITIELDTKAAPNNSNSIAFLAKQGYYDKSPCHRLVASSALFILQCGDPTGTGSGTPGYTTADENLPKGGAANYPAGTVAMAEPSGGQAGSQFFIVFKDSTLQPNYTIVGQVSQGLDIVKKVAKGGNAANGIAPATPVTIKTVTINQA